MHIINFSEEICRFFFARLTLKERLYVRSVCRRWKCTIESMCLQIRSLDFEISPMARYEFRYGLKRLYNNFLEHTFDGSLNVSQKYITGDFGRLLAGLMPNLDRLEISGDGSLYHAEHLMFLLEHWNALSSLSIDGVMKITLITPDEVLKLISTKTKLTRLDILVELASPIKTRSWDTGAIKWDLSRELSPILPRLTHFSVRNHSKATLPGALLQLGPQCSYLRLEHCDCVIRDIPNLQYANNVEHLYLKENDASIPAVFQQFVGLRTLEICAIEAQLFHFKIIKLTLGLDFFTHLNQMPNLTTLVIESTGTLISIAVSELARYQQKQVKSLTLISQGWFLQFTSNSEELFTGDDICRLYAALFPSVEIFCIKSFQRIVSEKDLHHFAALQKFKVAFTPHWNKAKWQAVSGPTLI